VSFDDLDIEQLRRTKTGEKWQDYAADVLPAWVADMDFDVAPPIQRLLRETAEHSDVGYARAVTPDDIPAAFAARAARRFGWEVDPASVEMLTDVVQGIYVGLEVFSEPGDGVLIQTPIYPPFLAAPRDMKRRAVTCPLVRGEAGYEIDFDALRATIDASTSVFLLCNPHNPTGRCFTRGELEGLADLALEHDMTVLADEIHGDLVYEGQRYIPFASLSP